MQPKPQTLAAAVRHLRRADPVLAAIILRVGACRFRVHREGGDFASLARAIVYQQLAGTAAAAIHGRLMTFCGGHPRPEPILAASDAELRALGLSRQKSGYLRDLARRTLGGLPLGRLAGLSDDEVIATLTQVRGIGRWSAEMFLMFHLGRLDVLPVDDYGIRKAMQRAWRKRALPKPDWMRRVAEPWRPYRSVACWFLWALVDGGAGE